MYIGTIADDLTGATDMAGFLANGGLDVVQFMGIPDGPAPEADAAVVSLKSRSLPAGEAVDVSLRALAWLRKAGCRQFYFKYCSTFDSTSKGNIGPVTDAILGALGSDFTVLCPSLPVNKRTVKGGILYVDGVPLSDTGMRHHPINPMTDSDLTRLMEMQAKGRAGVVSLDVVARGAEAVGAELERLRRDGCRYAVLDAVTDGDLDVLAAALDDMPLITGGSGMGEARAKRVAAALGRPAGPAKRVDIPRGKTVVLSGSCSEMTNRQVATYLGFAPGVKVEVECCLDNPDGYAAELASWVGENAGGEFAPLAYATVGKEELAVIQKRFGVEPASRSVEDLFTRLTRRLDAMGFDRFIVAGGETSGSVSGALPARAFRLGPEIAPGVPWIRGVDHPYCQALKSGNFGDENFFAKAQEMMHG